MRTQIPLLLAAALLLSGCATFKKPKAPTWPWSKAAKAKNAEIPSSMVVVWSDMVYTEPGKPPVRGFGGRAYFYNDKNHPVPVSGQLAVFGFDDSLQDKTQAKAEADRKFVYTPQQLSERLADGPLGPSYHIWVPWDQVGGDHKQVSLIPVLTTDSGQIVRGKPSLNVLPGRNLAREQAQYAKHFLPQAASVAQVTHQEPGSHPTVGARQGSAGDTTAGPTHEALRSGMPAVDALPNAASHHATQPPLRSTTITVPKGMSDRRQGVAAAVVEGSDPSLDNRPLAPPFALPGPVDGPTALEGTRQTPAWSGSRDRNAAGPQPSNTQQPSAQSDQTTYRRMWHPEARRQARFEQNRSRAQAWPGARSAPYPAQ